MKADRWLKTEKEVFEYTKDLQSVHNESRSWISHARTHSKNTFSPTAHSPFQLFSITTLYLWLGILAFIPLLLVLITSFLSHTDSHLLIWRWTLSNYHRLLSDAYFTILMRSLKLAFVSTLLCLFIGYPTA